MKFSEAKVIVAVNLILNRVVMLWGRSGMGKTEWSKALSEYLKWGCMIMHPVTDESIDYKGFPVVCADNESAKFVPYGNLLRMMTATSPLLVIIDDFGQASPDVHKALMHVLQEREINGKKISEHVRFLLISNREQDQAGVNRMISPIKSRVSVHLEIDPDGIEFIMWGLENGIHPAVIGYIAWKTKAGEEVAGNENGTSAIHSFDPKSKDHAYACARTWHFLSDQLHAGVIDQLRAAIPDAGRFNSVEKEYYKGVIGSDHATGFQGFMRIYRELPSPLDVLSDPEGTAVPPSIDSRWAICSALIDHCDAVNFGNCLKYISRFGAECFQVLFIQMAEKAKPEIKSTSEYTQWQIANQEVSLGNI